MTHPSRPARPLPLLPALLALALVGGCGDARNAGETPPHRSSDGLLVDTELQELVALQVARDGAALVGRLEAPRAEVRARAALALASVQDPEAVGALVAALSDSSAAVRRDAAFALGQTGSADVLALLLEAYAAEEDAGVRRRILEALGKSGSLEAVQALTVLEAREGDEAERVLALARLGATRSVATRESQELLLERLAHSDAEVRRNAAWYFGRLPNAIPWAGSADRVREALDRAGREDPEALPLTLALGRLADPADGGRLRGWLSGSGDWRIRTNAAAALALLPPDQQTREAFLAALDDPSDHVAATAAQALARGNPIPSELQRIKGWIEANPERWQAAAPLLLLLARGDEREFVFAWVDATPAQEVFRWSAGLQALAAVPGAEALQRLRRAVAAEDPRIQGAGVQALVERWSQDRFFAANHQLYFDILVDALDGESLQAAFAAARTLSDPTFVALGAGDALATAFAGMESPRELEPMLAVLESLGRIGGPEATATLSAAATHPHPAVRSAAAAALEAFGAPVPSFQGADAPGDTGSPSATTPALDWGWLASLGPEPVLRLETDAGTVALRLAPEEAPLTVQTVARLASEGRYDGVPFHRVVPNFVAQGGDFSSGDGFGGPGFTIVTEHTLVPFAAGVVGMASAGKDTEGSQFFITHSRQPHLDGGYTAFGWVVEGMDVVERIQVGDRILAATVEPGR